MPFDRQVEIAKMNYTHLTQEERYQIYALKKAGHKQNEIANVLERSESTISRELARDCGRRGYRPKQAHCSSVDRRAMNARTIDDATWQFTHERLLEQWSPEQISGHAAISPETIYQHISVSMRTSGQVAYYGRTCAARSNARNVMARSIGVA